MTPDTALALGIDAYLVGLRVCLKFVGDPQCCETCGASYAAHLLREAAASLPATRPTPQEPLKVCADCRTAMHCEHHQRCLAECSPADLAASLPQGDGLAWLTDEVTKSAIEAYQKQYAAPWPSERDSRAAMRDVLTASAKTRSE